jgi:hypothetical protein
MENRGQKIVCQHGSPSAFTGNFKEYPSALIPWPGFVLLWIRIIVTNATARGVTVS